MKNNIALHIIYLLLFYLICSYNYQSLTFENLLFLIKPVNTIFVFFVKTEPIYKSGSAYYYESLNIVINKSCSGFIFFITSYVIIYSIILKYEKRILIQKCNFALTLLLSYLATIYFNSARIIISYLAQNTANYFLPNRPHHLIHEVTGQIVYIISYFIIIYILIKYYTKFYIWKGK